MKEKLPILLVIAGPTAVGKTALCVELAQKLRTEIISADSRQFYRELAIGTAKPTKEEQGGVKHHFIDSHSIQEYFSPGDFEREALILLERLFQKHEVVILTGGSGLYIKALLEGLDEMPEVDLVLREQLMQQLEKEGIAPLWEQLQHLDPMYAAQVDQQNPQRIVRALEVCLSTGKPYSDFRKKQSADRPFQAIKICLDRPREELYARIDQRMDQMLAQGLVDEAIQYQEFQHLYALKTLGYKEVYGHLRGEYDETEMVRLLKRNSRHYAKKQLTWFRHQGEFQFLHPDEVKGEVLRVVNEE
ncbi:tRNA dimethylallyltransferase [Aquirufa nivalisilvae]|uniref:tRNA dimethylallyltransferase n=1 Tax=Aquirufa nivalisilvae TaxID=2516557 RepID=A0A2S2DW43_9BACT|nr:tRNA (adenosine(37)-N6)-dimethylallyltransferase MiaA [Aquirufa nivalisilvae]AWL09621.1 tRNA dimethylallyltransferase [Aquirufa nivalisilvae]MCZ2480966.1 tRNA (adenosine(37)-N6)-dimethylallyltransferase MiaA [Aquirufa nivalisilvae]